MPHINCKSIGNMTWQEAGFSPFTLNNNVHTWLISISHNLHLISHFTDMLSADEQGRAGSYHYEKDRQRFIISRGALRILLSKYLMKQPADIELVTGDNKKPFVNTGVSLHYNVSHSGDHILIAVSDLDVGVDMEQTDNNFAFIEILPLCFSRQEADLIEKATHPRSLFYQLWTRKEAITKATAKGIDTDLVEVPCIDGYHAVNEDSIGSAHDWEVSSFAIGEHYTGSIACNALIQNVLFWNAGNILNSL